MGKILSETIKVGSVLASITAVVYLLGFGLSARVNIMAYISLTDYLRVFLGWIVPVWGLVVLAAYFFPKCFITFRHSKETKPGSDRPTCEHQRRLNLYFKLILGILVFSVFYLVVLMLLGEDMKRIFIAATLVAVSGWLTTFSFFTRSVEDNIRIGYEKVSLMLFVPTLLIFSLGLGLSHGAIAEKTSSSIWSDFVIVTAENNLQYYGELMFSLEKFLVIRESGHTELTFLPSDRVTSIRTTVSMPYAPGLQSNKK